ncbi:heparan-alpha-glucosaminide N-acetyltransferase domain-containing protein [Polaribacter atrinae]|uniref:heparan-alpha-glucosaminide N-acetyltransferase domain-containing protein n=2 Tax=Polaribacter TaxID=52959 RepID=UPI0030F5F4B7
MQASVPNTKQRLDAVDALRGFAILAIMLLHSIEHFNFYVFPDASLQPAWLTTLDGYIWDTLFFLFGGKGYAIFALLF